jgi:hypothetical protein
MRHALAALALLAPVLAAPVLMAALIVPVPAAAQTPPVEMNTDRASFMVVLRESPGQNRPDDRFTPTGPTKLKLADGKEVELNHAWWEYIGDLHVRFVFDSPATMRNATPTELEQIGIKTVDEALALAVANIRRTYGAPRTQPLAGGIISVLGRSEDVNSSYFLDRAFWQDLLKQHPEGLVAAVPARGMLIYTPLSDTRTVGVLRNVIGGIYQDAARLRVSSALYLFKDGVWTVFQAPAARN